MKDISTIQFHTGSKEEVLPGYTPEFPYIASHVVLGGLRRFVTSAGRRAATCHSVSGTRPRNNCRRKNRRSRQFQ